MRRRNFLRQSGAVALGSVLFSKKVLSIFSPQVLNHPAGLQLYTLLSVLDNDVPGGLEKVAAIGYKEIESAFSRKGGFYGMTATEFAKLASDKGLAWKSHHVSGVGFRTPNNTNAPKNLKDNYQEIVDTMAGAGVEYLVCAGIPLGKSEEISEAVEILTKTGEACKKANVTFCYHNHTAEFIEIDGRTPYDVLLSQINADIMKMELDLAWATHAGMNPVDLFKKHPGRFPLWHVKDLDKESGRPVEVGAGFIDFKPIFEDAAVAGMKHFFVEQDGAPKPYENIATSFNNLKEFA